MKQFLSEVLEKVKMDHLVSRNLTLSRYYSTTSRSFSNFISAIVSKDLS